MPFHPTKLHCSFRRELIDHELLEHSSQFRGIVLDLGGKKENKRGVFRPPDQQVDHWIYLNIKTSERPDIVGSAELLPLKDCSVDWIICTEVLEFINNSEQMFSEVNRILKKGGCLFLTTPFLYRIHDQPHDLQRFTNQKLKLLCEKVSLSIKLLQPQGFFFTVIADFLKQAISQVKFRVSRYACAAFILPVILLLRQIDKTNWVKHSPFLSSFTTGYVLVAEKSA